MKVFIAVLFCIVAVFGVEVEEQDTEPRTEHQRKMHKLLTEASKACVLEMKLDTGLINDKGPSMDDRLNENDCYLACLNKKMGVMKEDGTFSMERILSFEDTPEKKQRAERAYNNIVKECSSIDTKDSCKMAGCFHKTLRTMTMSGEW